MNDDPQDEDEVGFSWSIVIFVLFLGCVIILWRYWR
jgi:hypothetical protein